MIFHYLKHIVIEYFRDNVPNITEMLKPLRDMVLVSRGAICQQLYFLDDTTTPIPQTDASDYGVGACFYEIFDGKVRVIRFFSKSLTGAQLNWSTILK